MTTTPNPHPDLTFTEDQWLEVTNPEPGSPRQWQHKENPEIFSYDHGETWYDLDGNTGVRL